MAFPSIVDIDQLAAAITEEQPTGSDIRNNKSPTSDYYTIKDARNSARAAERSAMFEDDDVDLLPLWRDVVKAAEKILTDQSKDLEVAAWYTEALIRLHGFAGLRDGLALIDRLINDHWDGLFPEPDEDGLETKLAPIIGLNGDGGEGTLMVPIRNAPITPEGDYRVYSFFQYQQARDADRIEDEDAKAARVEVLGCDLAEFNECVNAISAEWAQDLVETLESTSAIYKNLNDSLRVHCGRDAPPSSNISKLLDEILRTVRFIYKAQLDALAAASAAELSAENSTVSDGADSKREAAAIEIAAVSQGGSISSGPIASREDALKLLELAASYFRTFEPHTPLAPSLERLISWGRMSVSELMMELLPDTQARAIYSQLTGVTLDGSEGQRHVAPAAEAASTAASSTAPAQAESNGGKESSAAVGW